MADFDWQAVILGTLGGGTLTGIVTALFSRRKTSAEAAKIESEAARIDIETSSTANELLLRTIQEQRVQIQEQNKRIDLMDLEIVRLRSAIQQLQDALLSAGVPHISIGARSAPPLDDPI